VKLDLTDIDLLEVRKRIAILCMLKQGRSTANIAAQLKMRESDLVAWVRGGAQMLQAAENTLVTEESTPTVRCVLE
jgi:hypothetical protein